MIKRIRIFTFALLFTASAAGYSTIPATAAETSWYSDVVASHWAFEKIKFATDKEIISGYPGNVFKPEGMVTCEEAISMLYGTLAAMDQMDDEQEDYTETYIDILDKAGITQWSRKVVAYALHHEIITEAEMRTFVQDSGAGRPALREETAVWSAKAMSKPVAQVLVLSYLDTPSISEAAVPYVDLVLRERVMTGDNKNQFLPKSNIKRCEFASVCKSIYDSNSVSAFSLTRDVVNVSGQVTAVSAAGGKLTLKGDDNLTRYLTIPAPPQGASGLKVGDTVVVGHISLENESGISLQVMGKSPEQYILDVSLTDVQKLVSADGKTYYAAKVVQSGMGAITYLIDGNTAIFNSSGQTVSPDRLSGANAKIICDGIKILEIKI